MASITPVSAISYKGMPSKTPQRKVMPDVKKENKNEGKKPFPWGKFVLITAAVTGFIAFVLTRNPSRAITKKQYAEIFSGTLEQQERKFKNISMRDEVIINEVINGNKAAKNLLPTVSEDASKIIAYEKASNKVARMDKYLDEGRFDTFHRENETAEHAKKTFMKQYDKLNTKKEALYKEAEYYLA